MYEYIEGKLAFHTPQVAVIDVGGIGYKLAISPLDEANLPPKGSLLRLYTSLIVRENEQTLYGFLEEGNRSLFESLITISGIGPKTALAILGSLSLNLLHEALLKEEPKLLAKVPGIGKKTAERLLIELKDKLPPLKNPLPNTGKVEDAISALIHLGYSRLRAQEALKEPLAELGEEADTALLITTALRKLS